MTGYRSLLALRMANRKPTAVFVTLLDHPAPRDAWTYAERALDNGSAPEIDIEPDDDMSLLDLRAVRGTTVHLSGRDTVRLMAAMDALLGFEPGRIVCAVTDPQPLILDWTAETGLVEHALEAA